MEEKTQTMAVPAWFYVVAVLALLWEAIGCYMYVTQVSADPATLPIDQRAMWEASPPWMIAAYAFGVWIGLFGAALLLLRRKAAETMLLVSFLAVVVQFSALLLVPALRDRTPSDALLLPLIITAICYAIWIFSRLSRRRGWLR